MSAVICWFRRDLRVADNPALSAAAASGLPIIPVYIHAPNEAGSWAPGEASNWWLHHSLLHLKTALEQRGLRLVVRRGESLAMLREIIATTEAQAVHWNRLYEPAYTRRDTQIKQALRDQGVSVQSHQANLLHEPWTIKTGSGGDYKAFTPFWRACRRLDDPEPPLPAPDSLSGFHHDLSSEAIEALDLHPGKRWTEGLASRWQPGEASAQQQLSDFVHGAMGDYEHGRDWPATAGTSRLSARLHFGEVSPRQVWQAAQRQLAQGSPTTNQADYVTGADRFLSEIGWREFAHHVLFHHPDFPDQPLNPRFAAFPWQADPGDRLLHTWQQGRTGIPLVDAGMRELYATGWMHNRVRMVVGSFLVKNLRLPWQAGEAWFWDTLVDADMAANSLGWQWVAGSGADAAPYFRVFNPVRQGERFDAQGDYVAHWVPELAGLAAKHRHAPWEAPASALADAGVTLGVTYPQPMVDLKQSRQAALAAFAQIKKPD
ncbi:MAG: deoxyribodipyrimidine photo-lyase [Spiribacter sp.]|nr:deoxyribodipyrimidine photo-lyase [Spiribacter sp.]